MTQFSDTQYDAYNDIQEEDGVEVEQLEDGDIEGTEAVEPTFVPSEDLNDDETDLDVDSVEGDDETEDVSGEPEAKDTKEKPAKKEEKTTKRGDLPEGYTTPVGLAKIITERGLYTTREGVVAELKPQMVYSYAKNAPKDNPFPAEAITDSNGLERNVVNIEAGVEWWVKKNSRAQERRENAAKKASDKADKAKAKAEAAEVTEAEGDEAVNEALEVSEAE